MAKTAFLAACFMAASTWAAIQFKFAASASGGRAVWHFVWGSIIGALGPLALTLALRRGNPNVVYALCYGGAFTLLQLISWRLFQQPLSATQWTGVAFVGIGILLLHLRSV